jgi:hypothetical protein
MSTRKDPLLERRQPDRLFYATGMLLDQKDFEDEQTYHRLQLARSLACLHGNGTAAGLRAQWDPPIAPGADPQFPDGREGELVVDAGLAVDRLGRLIEVPRHACIRLKRWYDAQPVDQLVAGFHSAFYQGVVADLFIRFVACERGKTPAFASGPFDATNAAVASRVRDGYELKLFVRPESDVPPGVGENRVPLQGRLPVNPWPDLAAIANVSARRTALREAVFNAWNEETTLSEQAEHLRGQDPTFVFLARLVIPATAGAANQRPAWNGEQVQVQNESRLFVYTANALARALSL